MKKSDRAFIIISVVFLIIAIAATTFEFSFLFMGLNGKINNNKSDHIVGLILFIIFDALNIIVCAANIIPSLSSLIKTRNKFSILIFIISSLLFLASVVTLCFIGKIL